MSSLFAMRAAVVLIALSQSTVLGFTSPQNNPAAVTTPHGSFSTELQGSISKWNDEYASSDEDEDEGIMLSASTLRKKKGSKGKYKKYDDGEGLPFVVKVKTPDPYTPSKVMLNQAKQNSKIAKDMSASKGSNNKKGKSSNLVGMLGSKYANGIAASIYTRNKDGSLYKVLGQFELDKSTSCGDLLEVGEREFEVVTARAQFKYAGGKRFLMVRKILEVKEITRIAEEATLTRLMEKETESASGKNFE